ncbi:MAG: hypothetical protein WCK89_17780 [bacterium]
MSFPLKRGIASVSADGNYTSRSRGSFGGEPSKYVYAGTVEEKNNALVVVTDRDILVFDPDGNILQRVSDWSDQDLFNTPPGTNRNQ